MEIDLIAESDDDGRRILTLLKDEGINAVTKTLSHVQDVTHHIIVFQSVSHDKKVLKEIAALAARDNIIIAVAAHNTVLPEMEDVYQLPSDIRDDILVSLVNCFYTSRDREAHYSWITDELSKVNHSLLEETSRLKAARDELDQKNRKMKEELVLANIIQNSLLPRQFPSDVPLNFSHKYIPHEYIGGDFFEIIQVDNGHLGVLIADVSGHGVASALITTMLKSVFNYAAQRCLSPSEVLRKLNLEFTHIMRTEHYITAFYAIIDVMTLGMKYANAGHPRQIILTKAGKTEFIGANGFFLGMFEQSDYEERALSLQPGDRLINYTDGIIECPDHHGQHFGQDNLLKTVAVHAAEDIETFSKNIIVDLIAFMADSRFPDDITLLISEVIPLLE